MLCATGACRHGLEALCAMYVVGGAARLLTEHVIVERSNWSRIGGVGLRRRGGRHKECAAGRRSLRGYDADKRTRDTASKTQGLII